MIEKWTVNAISEYSLLLNKIMLKKKKTNSGTHFLRVYYNTFYLFDLPCFGQCANPMSRAVCWFCMHTGCLTCKILHIVSKGKKKATGFPGGTVVKNIPTIQEAQVQSLLSGRWSRKWQPTLVCLPGEFHGQMSQAGYSPWGRKESERGTLQRMLKRGMTKDRETSH